MSLKELTAEKHQAAESTKFMKAVFAKKMPRDLWADWTFQKCYFYKTIEAQCNANGFLLDLPDIERTHLLIDDYAAMHEPHMEARIRPTTLEYCNYIVDLPQGPRVLAHLYTWHMGDMFGGQMIKKIVDAPHSNLEFNNMPMLMSNLRAKLDDSLGEEANIAFDWAIRMMNEYDSSLE